MAAIPNFSPSAGRATKAQVPSCASSIWPDVDTNVMPVVICGASLLIVILLATYGVDLSVGSY